MICPKIGFVSGLSRFVLPTRRAFAAAVGVRPGRRPSRTMRRRTSVLEAIERRLLPTTVIDIGSAVDAVTPGAHFVSTFLGGDAAVAAINNAGLAAGTVDDLQEVGVFSLGVSEGYLFHNGSVTAPPPNISSSDTSSITGINDSDEFVGTFQTRQGELAGNPQAFVDSSAVGLILLPPLAMFTSGSYANAINNAGQVTGYAQQTNGIYHAFLYSGGAMKDLGTLPGFTDSEAFAINNSGQVVGNAFETKTGITHAFLFSNGKMTDLGTLAGFTNSGANAINNLGQVVGDSEDAGTSTVFATLYSNGRLTSLGTSAGFTDSEAYGINNAGQVVGEEWNTKTGVEHAFLDSGGTMIDLNSLLPANSGWELSQALAINNEGQIVGLGLYKGVGTSFLLELTSTAVHVASTANPAVFGQSVTFAATVSASPGAGIPTGTVTFAVVDLAHRDAP